MSVTKEERDEIYLKGYEVGYKAGLKHVNITARQQTEGLLSEEQVAVIKMQLERFGGSIKDLAKLYKVPKTYIEAIADGRIYTHVKARVSK